MIAIPNMEKPKICGECPLFIDHCYFDGNEWHNGCFSLEREIFEDELAPDCPLIEIDDEIWEALKPKVDTMSMALTGWVEDVLENKNGFGVDN